MFMLLVSNAFSLANLHFNGPCFNYTFLRDFCWIMHTDVMKSADRHEIGHEIVPCGFISDVCCPNLPVCGMLRCIRDPLDPDGYQCIP